MRHYCDEWIQEWCEANGWTDVILAGKDFYWAFPPQAVMPEPIPPKILQSIKAEKGLCDEEKLWLRIGVIAGVLSLVLSYVYQCPMPLVLAFALNAITVANLEVDF